MNARSILAATCIASMACLCGAAGKTGESFASRAQLPAGQFTIVNAQAIADSKRNAMYGACGMSIFKERKGSVWIFETKVGYGGRHEPDISVVEPPLVLPGFDRHIDVAVARSAPARRANPNTLDPDTELAQRLARSILESDRAVVSVLVPGSNEMKQIDVADRAWIESFSNVVAAAVFRPQSHLFAMGPPVTFYDRSGKRLLKLEVFESVLRVDNADYAIGRKSCDALKALIQEKNG